MSHQQTDRIIAVRAFFCSAGMMQSQQVQAFLQYTSKLDMNTSTPYDIFLLSLVRSEVFLSSHYCPESCTHQNTLQTISGLVHLYRKRKLVCRVVVV